MLWRTALIVPEAHGLELYREQLLLGGLDLGDEIDLDAEAVQAAIRAEQGAAEVACAHSVRTG